MKLSKLALMGTVVFAMSACQTTSKMVSPSSVLLANIETVEAPASGVVTKLSGTNPTCATFYKNTAAYVSQPLAKPSGMGGAGGSLLKTLVLGSLAGVASGGVASLGVSNSFLEAALVTTASQTTYNAGSTVYDKIVGTGAPDPELPVRAPMEEIQAAADALGCPAPDVASIKDVMTVPEE